MKKRIGIFAFIFITLTASFASRDIWGALFVGFFTALIVAFVFLPLVEKPMLTLVKKITGKLARH